MRLAAIAIVTGTLLSATVSSAATQVDVVDDTWTCRARQHDTQVRVRITGETARRHDAVHLKDGCTGSITLNVVIEKGWDCIKVHSGAHDLVVRGRCEIRGKVGDVHQDFIQAMGGHDITFLRFATRTAGQEGWSGGRVPGSVHSSFFVNQGTGQWERPSRIVCDRCSLEGGGSPVWVNEATASGVRNSVVVRGYWRFCQRHTKSSLSPVRGGNRCVAGRLGG